MCCSAPRAIEKRCLDDIGHARLRPHDDGRDTLAIPSSSILGPRAADAGRTLGTLL